jgi:uncharacterized protein (DUF58 family)
MSDLFDSKFLHKIEQLTLTARFSMDGTMSGNRKSRSKGSSVEFSDYREYAPGDDFRRIDWNAYGRFEKLFIKLFMEEREAPVTVYLDVSKSMDWGEPNKNIASRRLAAALAYISLANFDRVSVACIDDGVQQMCRDTRGKNFFHRLTGILENIQYTRGSNLQEAVESSRMLSGRGITVIISDFFSAGSFSELLKYLIYNKQAVHVCHILSPQEIHPAVNESVRLVDSETGERMDITVTPSLLNSYSKALEKFKSNMRQSCSGWGAYYYSFSSNLPVEEMVKEVAGH